MKSISINFINDIDHSRNGLKIRSSARRVRVQFPPRAPDCNLRSGWILMAYNQRESNMDDDRNAPATKADLAELETRITDRLTEVMRDVQTELLKSFYGFMETVQTRFKAQD